MEQESLGSRPKEDSAGLFYLDEKPRFESLTNNGVVRRGLEIRFMDGDEVIYSDVVWKRGRHLLFMFYERRIARKKKKVWKIGELIVRKAREED